MKFNITLRELEGAAKYAKEFGQTEHKTITMFVNESEDNGIGEVIEVSSDYSDTDPYDITNTDSW